MCTYFSNSFVFTTSFQQNKESKKFCLFFSVKFCKQICHLLWKFLSFAENGELDERPLYSIIGLEQLDYFKWWNSCDFWQISKSKISFFGVAKRENSRHFSSKLNHFDWTNQNIRWKFIYIFDMLEQFPCSWEEIT